MKKKNKGAGARAVTARRRARLAIGSPKPGAVEVPKPLRPPKHRKQAAEEDAG